MFGQRLRKLRNNTGKSQGTVAREIRELFPNARMSPSNLSMLEKRDSVPRGAVLNILCRYYDVPLSYFYNAVEGVCPPPQSDTQDAIEIFKLMSEKEK